MPEEISSFSNPYIKLLRSLKLKKRRDEAGLFVIDGAALVEEAVESGADIEAILVAKGAAIGFAYPDGCRVIELPKEILASVCESKSPQNIAAVVRLTEGAKALPASGLVLLLENVQDPANVGAMIRTADAAGAAMVVLGEGCADPYDHKALRASMGSVFHIPMTRAGDIPAVIGGLKEKGFCVIAGHLKGEERLPGGLDSVAVVIGNEGSGITPKAAEAASCLYRLPIRGQAESLNAAVACGIMIYDVIRSS